MGISLGRSKAERFLNIFVALAIFAIPAWILVGFWSTREIPFDAEQWKQAGVASDMGIRYRMVYKLRSKIEKMDAPNFADLRQLLGPPHSSSESLQPERLEYYLGASYRGPFITNSWHLRLSFDDKEQLFEVSIYPGS